MRRRLAAAAAALGFAVAGLHAQSAAAVDPVRNPNAVLYPRSGEQAPAAAAPAGPNGTMTIVLVCLLGAGAGWMLWNRIRLRGPAGQGGRQLVIAETKSLGNRQFLVVASYRDRQFLLGVCPGRIDLLAPLDGAKPDGNPPPFPL